MQKKSTQTQIAENQETVGFKGVPKVNGSSGSGKEENQHDDHDSVREVQENAHQPIKGQPKVR